MSISSPKISFDDRLLAVEELFKQRKYNVAIKELSKLNRTEFETKKYELGLYLLLSAEAEFSQDNYQVAIQIGLKSASLLADYPLNRRYGRVLIILSKSYSAIGDLKNAEIRARDSLSSFKRCRFEIGIADSLNELARISYIRCNYHDVANYLEEALKLVRNDSRKQAQLTGNLARIHIRTGKWDEALTELKETIETNIKQKEEVSLALNLLSLGMLQTRMRKFLLAGKSLDQALEIISRLGLKREKIIYLEYAGELAFEKGDYHKAKSILSKAFDSAMVMAPGSTLVSQSVRRLAEAELALDNIDEAMKYGQKALDTSIHVGERIEIGLSKRVIAQVFAEKYSYEEADEYINQALDILRDVNDPIELAKTLLVSVDIQMNVVTDNFEHIRSTLDEASRIFKSLKLDYWVAESAYKAGILACRLGDLPSGFKSLSYSEKMFRSLNDKSKIKAVAKFLKNMAEQAVVHSISKENEYKIFGNLITPSELSEIQSSRLEEILDILLNRTSADRAIVFTPDFEESPLNGSFPISNHQKERFIEGFRNMLGEEISRTKPTIILDCRRDPFINGLLSETADMVASIVVVPFKMSEKSMSYLYIDKLSRNNSLNPFTQMDLNFSVAYTDIIAFKWAEIQKNKLLEDNLRLKNQLREKAAFPNIVTQNADMLDLLSQVRQVVDSNISVLIEGDTGSGKDVLARAIHFNSARRGNRFVSVNCAALPETLLESELFGYKRGAFTGADRDKAGLIEEADKGTFFLDEIGDMPLSVQAKVLRVLEEQEIVRLGETYPRKVDVRIVSATNKDLKELMATKQFRQDLYYRITALSFKLPSLYNRKDDIPLLVNHFLTGSQKKFSPELMQLFSSYEWPGNIRELENEVKKSVLLAGDQDVIPPNVASEKIISGENKTGSSIPSNGSISDDVVFNEDFGLYDYVEHHEKRFIIRALKEKKGVKKHAADLLSIPESTLRLKIKQYNIDLSQFKR
jgi:Nif-specific regulatory protein